jgi:uncharacterized protein YgiM (DUF1202 family)
MKNYILLLFLIFCPLLGNSQVYDSKYAVFDRKVVLVRGASESSELVCVVPRGNPVRIVERVGGPFYKAQYKDKKGYLISFNLENRFKRNYADLQSSSGVRSLPGKTFVKTSRKTYITKKTDYRMVIAVPKRTTLEVLDRVKRGKYLVKYKGHIGYCDLGSFNVKDKTEQASLERMKINRSSKAKVVELETRATPQSELVLAEYKVTEVRKSEANKMIDLHEMLDLNITIKNTGNANAEELDIDVFSDQVGVEILGPVYGGSVVTSGLRPKTIMTGEYQSFTFRYFLNDQFHGQELKFRLRATDPRKGIVFTSEMFFPVNASRSYEQWKASRMLARDTWESESSPKDWIADVEDVGIDIPVSGRSQKKTYALIIGNEDYRSRQRTLSVEQNAEFAINDAEIFRKYCERTLGIPQKQIKILRNATAAEISQGLAWINNLSKIENGNANLIFYYSGHGLPDEDNRSPVLVPVDVSANNIRYGIPLSDAYAALIEHPAKQVTVFLDACFSGAGKNQSLLPRKGIKVRANKNAILGNMVVFSSSSETETSSVYREARHGYFTYYLLKKLKETRGNIKYDDLSSYLIRSVSKETGLNGIIQTPEVNASQKVADTWQDWKLK